MKITVLGCGLVGGPLAVDLAAERSFAVTIVDIDAGALKRVQDRARVETIRADVSDPARVRELVGGCDLAVSAVPGKLGFSTLQAIIETGRDVVDIAFFAEDPFLLDEMAKAKAVRAIVDCGVMPGMGNILVSRAAAQLEETEEALIYVGGLPLVREWPYEYKAVFSPTDVIEEYTRPARFIEHGRMVIRPALSDPEYLHFPGIGTLEAFNSDGLRTMLTTIPALNMKEKTLRYPGHAEKMAMLRETGFFGKEEIEIHGTRLSPLDFTCRILFPKWKLQEGEADLTVMKILVRGKSGGKKKVFHYDMLDRYDAENRIPSMARTTGYTATAVVRLLAAGLYDHQGITAPEYIGRQPECVDFLLDQLARRGIHFHAKIEPEG